MKKPEGIIFDLDRTLYDRFSTLRGIAFLMKREHSDWLPPELSAYALGEALVAADYWLIYQGWEAVYAWLVSQGIFRSPPGLSAFSTYILDEGFCRVAVSYPGTETLLKDLRVQGYRLGLITNGPSKRQRKKLALLGLLDVFDEILISGEYGADKPEPEIFREISRRMGIPVECLAYVGDSMETDIAGANRAGLYAIRVQTSPDWGNSAATPDAYIQDIFELPALLAHFEGASHEQS